MTLPFDSGRSPDKRNQGAKRSSERRFPNFGDCSTSDATADAESAHAPEPEAGRVSNGKIATIAGLVKLSPVAEQRRNRTLLW
jgi:hypothetical protein